MSGLAVTVQPQIRVRVLDKTGDRLRLRVIQVGKNDKGLGAVDSWALVARLEGHVLEIWKDPEIATLLEHQIHGKLEELPPDALLRIRESFGEAVRYRITLTQLAGKYAKRLPQPAVRLLETPPPLARPRLSLVSSQTASEVMKAVPGTPEVGDICPKHRLVHEEPAWYSCDPDGWGWWKEGPLGAIRWVEYPVAA